MMSTSLADARHFQVAAHRELGTAASTGMVVLTAGIAFFNLSSLNPDKSAVGVDLFVLVKLGMTTLAGVIGVYGVLAVAEVRRALTTFPGAWLSFIAFFFLVASFFSSAPNESLTATAALWSILCFATTCIVLLGKDTFLRANMLGLAIFIVVSWVFYLLVPGIGIFEEPLLGGQEATRMSGIAHPNTVGQYSGLYIGLVFLLQMSGRLRRGGLWWMLVPLAMAAMYFSMSRASMIALAAAMVFVGRRKIVRFLGPIGVVAILLLLVITVSIGVWQFGLAGDSLERLLTSISKSGELEEVTTLTGRTQIWAYAWEQLQERPWGFGPARSRDILRDYISYTHNLWLNVAFCGGLFAAICCVALTIGRVRESLIRPHAIVDFLLIFIFVNGLAENIVFSQLPSAPTMLLVLAVMWHWIRQHPSGASGGRDD